MPEPREPKPPLVSRYDADRLSTLAVAAQAYRNLKMQEGAMAEATKQEGATAKAEADKKFLKGPTGSGILENPEYQKFVRLLDERKMKEAELAAEDLIDQIDGLIKKVAPESADQLRTIKDRLIIGALTQRIKK
jgi:hypothetical protein